MMHDWASLKFQFADRSSGLKSFQTKYIFQLIASQIFMLTPLLLVLFFTAGIKILKRWRSIITERNLMITGVFIVLGFIFISPIFSQNELVAARISGFYHCHGADISKKRITQICLDEDWNCLFAYFINTVTSYPDYSQYAAGGG